MKSPVRIALIIADERDARGNFNAPSPYFGPGPAALLEGLSRQPEVETHIISCTRKPIPAPERIYGRITFHEIATSRGYRSTAFLEPVRAVRRLLCDIQPHFVQGVGTEDYQGLAAAFSGFANSVSILGNMRAVARARKHRPFPHMHIAAAAEHIALRRAKMVLANSRYTAECVKSLNDNIHLIPNAVRRRFFESEPAEPAGSRDLICVGEICPYKNQLALIKALEDRRPPQVQLIFAGHLDRRSRYGRKFLDAVSAHHWCAWPGPLSLDELIDRMQHSAALIHPSKEEGFGLVAAEAQALGLPVAVSDCCGLRDIVEHEQTGFLFNPDRPDAIADTAARLLDPVQTYDIIARARASCRKYFHPDAVAAAHVELYKRVLSAKGQLKC